MKKKDTRRKIVFLAANSSYSHTSLAALYLQACTADMELDWTTVEFVATEDFQPALHRIEQIKPDVIATTFYVFNRNAVLSVLRRYRLLDPKCRILAGGPEFLGDNRDFMTAETCVNAVIRGEGESAFRQLMTDIARPERWPYIPGFCGIVDGKYIDNGFADEIADLDKIPSPFAVMAATPTNDIPRTAKGRAACPRLPPPAGREGGQAHAAAFQSNGSRPKGKPFLQLETSRGCRNNCAFCTSGASTGVRYFSIGRVRSDLKLMRRAGVTSVRIVDRTFNENRHRCIELLRMFREEFGDMSFHLEIDPALLGPRVLREMEAEDCGTWQVESGKWKNGVHNSSSRTDIDQRATNNEQRETSDERRATPHLHLDVGVQSFGAGVLKTVGRRGSVPSAVRGLKALCGLGNVAVHADLIAGLPGATLQQVFHDLRRLVAIRPAEIQLELLKLLPGTRLSKEREKFGIVASPEPPYEVLRTGNMTAGDIYTARLLCKLTDWFYEPVSLRETIWLANDILPSFWQNLVDFCGSEKKRANVQHSTLNIPHGSVGWTTPSLENRFRLLDDFLSEAGCGMWNAERGRWEDGIKRPLAEKCCGPWDVKSRKWKNGFQNSRPRTDHDQRATSNDQRATNNERRTGLRHSLRYAWMKHGLNPASDFCQARPWKEPVPADAELVEGDASAEVCRMFAMALAPCSRSRKPTDGFPGTTCVFAYGRRDVSRRAVAVWKVREVEL